MRRDHRIIRGLACLVGAIAIGSCSGDSTTGPRFGPPAALIIEGGQDQSAVVGTELATALTAKVVDASGRSVRGVAVNFRIVSGGGSVFAGVAITTDSGIARERWTLGTTAADSQRVEARAVDAAGNALVFGVFRATARPDVPAIVTKVAGDTQTVVVGTLAPDSLAVRVEDRFSNPVPLAIVRWAVTSGGGNVSADSTVTNAEGVATTRWTVGEQVAAVQQVTATVGTLAGQTFEATTREAVPFGIAITTPAAGAASGAPFATAPVVRLVDEFGNTASTGTNAITLSVSAGGTLVGPTTVTPTDGEATFVGAGLSGVVDEYILTYSATGLEATTQAIALVAGAPTELVVTTQPAGAVSGAVFTTQPVVELRDNAGNRTTSTSTVTAAIASGSGVLLGTAGVAASDGVATFTDLRIDRAESHTLRFDVAMPVLSATADALTVVAGPVASVTILEGNQQSAEAGTTLALPILVRVSDGFGNHLSGVTVSWSVAAGGGSIAASTSVTDADGIATAPAWTIGAEGSGLQRLVAAVGAFPVEVTAAIRQPPVAITIETNAPASVRLGSTLSPTFLVRDADGNVVWGVPVTVAVTAGGGQLTNPPTESGALPTSIGSWTVGSTLGTQTVTVSVAGIPSATITTETITEYALEVRWNGPAPSLEVQAAFDNAVSRLRSIIVGPQAGVAFSNFDANACVPGLTLNETIPGLLIIAAIEPIDGPGGSLGSAGPCYVRQSNSLTIVGQMRFDSVDLPNILASGVLESLILHEMLHVIGVGTLWNLKSLKTGNAPESTPFFTGSLARDACINDHAGSAFCSSAVPIEDCLNLGFTCGTGTINSHWKESVFRTELMTGFLSLGVNPFSKMTIQSLADLAYEVNVSAADPYTVPPASLMSPTPSQAIRMPNPHGPVAAVNTSGQITRTYTPIPQDH